MARLENGSARYIAGYIEKKLTREDDPRLEGRHPEFNRMSRHNGGIGRSAMWDVASTYLQYDLEKSEIDVASALRHGKMLAPLGKYLRRELRKMIGRDEKIPAEVLKSYEAELQTVWENLRETVPHAQTRKLAFREYILAKNEGAVASMMAKSQIRKQRQKI